MAGLKDIHSAYLGNPVRNIVPEPFDDELIKERIQNDVLARLGYDPSIVDVEPGAQNWYGSQAYPNRIKIRSAEGIDPRVGLSHIAEMNKTPIEDIIIHEARHVGSYRMLKKVLELSPLLEDLSEDEKYALLVNMMSKEEDRAKIADVLEQDSDLGRIYFREGEDPRKQLDYLSAVQEYYEALKLYNENLPTPYRK